MEKVNLAEAFDGFTGHREPRIAGELNGQEVKLAKIMGAFDWHHHENEDELFLAVRGSFEMEFRDRSVTVNEGEFIIVPRKTEHRPVAREEAHILLFEPKGTLNTGNVETERTVRSPETL